MAEGSLSPDGDAGRQTSAQRFWPTLPVYYSTASQTRISVGCGKSAWSRNFYSARAIWGMQRDTPGHMPSFRPLSVTARNISARVARHGVAPRHLLISRYKSLCPSRPPLSLLQSSHYATMAIETAPLPLPPSADASKFTEFGREVKGINPGTLSAEQFAEIEKLLYKVRAIG